MVHPLITPTRSELILDYVTSFIPLDDATDESIDRLSRDLVGVTHLSARAMPLVEHVGEHVGGVDENEYEDEGEHVDMDAELPTPPPQSDLFDLMNNLLHKFDDFKTTICERMQMVEEKLVMVEEKLVEVDEKVETVLEKVGVQPTKRESRKSKHVKSPFVPLKYDKKKTKKDNEEAHESGEPKEGDKEKVEGSGEVEFKEVKVDLFRPINEEKKKLFYAFYNEEGSDVLINCKTGEYPRKWFDNMLRMGCWLEDSVS